MYFLRLIRIVNLLIIVLTMVGVTQYYLPELSLFDLLKDVDLILLIVSTVLIAAAGNIINDYFDVKADRINRPDSIIITRHIKRRWAIVVHWSFNMIAFIIGLYLSIRYHSPSILFLFLFSMATLWLYSVRFKRTLVIGNLQIATLTSLVIFLTHYFIVTSHSSTMIFAVDPRIDLPRMNVVILLMLIAFIQNLAREITKDIQDVKGDLQIHARTIPIVIGKKYASLISAVILAMLPLMFGLFSIMTESPIKFLTENWVITLAALLNIIAALTILFQRSQIKLVNTLIKVSMLLGIDYLFL